MNEKDDVLEVKPGDELFEVALMSEAEEISYYDDRLNDPLAIWRESEVKRAIELGLIDDDERANLAIIADEDDPFFSVD